ncbi:MAG TPA: hypothetical protein PL051_04725 [Candidatus Saccharibacteria bacterium]|nr:hypothetical protein [Candidatus Saccharibacteria bacterium]
MADNDVALRKRQQIEKAGRTMFLWVAAAAAVVGIAAVLAISLFQRLVFNQKVLNAKNETISVLRDNNAVVNDLKDNVRVLNTNSALLNTDRSEGSEPIAVVLDALPSQPNSSALGASLQQKLLDVDGVVIEALTVTPIAGVEDTIDTGDNASTDSDTGDNEIRFQFTVSTKANKASALKEVLKRIERSIRAIDIYQLSVEQQNDSISLSVEGRAFFEPEVTVELKKESIKP